MFLMLSILVGLPAVAIPVIIHLLHKQRTRLIKWGAMQFLAESVLQQKRRRKIDQWLLMAARIGVLAFLVMALSRPVLPARRYSPLGDNAATDVCVVMDRSLSMGRHSGEKTLLEQAADSVDAIAKGLRRGDTLSVVVAEHEPRALMALPVVHPNVDELRTLVHELKPGLTDGPIPAAVARARQLIGRGRNMRKVIVVFSDEQRAGWDLDNEAAWKLASRTRPGASVEVYAFPLKAEPAKSNVSVGRLHIEPGLVGVNCPVQITSTIGNSGPTGMPTVPLKLIVDGKVVAGQNLTDLPAGQSRTIRFDQTVLTPGSHWVKLEADVADGLAADNSSLAAITAWDKLPVLIIDGEMLKARGFRSSQFLQAAFTPTDPSQAATGLVQSKIISVIDAPSVSLESYAVVIVNDVGQLPPEMPTRLADYAREGRGVWFILGPRTQQKLMSRQLAQSRLFTAEVGSIRKADTPPAVVIKEPSHPMVALLTAADRNATAGVLTSQWWAVTPSDKDAKVVVATGDGDPLIFERLVGDRGGRVAVWCTSVDGDWSHWPLLGKSFVPLVNETLFHLASSQARGARGQQLDAGQPIVWTTEPNASAIQEASKRGTPRLEPQSVQVAQPDNKLVTVEATAAAGRWTVRYADTFIPGLYEMRFAQTAMAPVHYAVGIDPHELDAATLSAGDLSRLRDRGFIQTRIDKDDLLSVVTGSNRGSELWPGMVLAVAFLMVLETLMTYRMLHLQEPLDVAHAGIPGVRA